MKTSVDFWSYLAHFFLEWEMVQKRVVEKTETHILCSVTFFVNRAVYEIMWENIVEPGRPRVALRMRISCWVPKATIRHSKYVILTAFPLQQWITNAPQCYVYICNARLVLFNMGLKTDHSYLGKNVGSGFWEQCSEEYVWAEVGESDVRMETISNWSVMMKC